MIGVVFYLTKLLYVTDHPIVFLDTGYWREKTIKIKSQNLRYRPYTMQIYIITELLSNECEFLIQMLIRWLVFFFK